MDTRTDVLLYFFLTLVAAGKKKTTKQFFRLRREVLCCRGVQIHMVLCWVALYARRIRRTMCASATDQPNCSPRTVTNLTQHRRKQPIRKSSLRPDWKKNSMCSCRGTPQSVPRTFWSSFSFLRSRFNGFDCFARSLSFLRTVLCRQNCCGKMQKKRKDPLE